MSLSGCFFIEWEGVNKNIDDHFHPGIETTQSTNNQAPIAVDDSATTRFEQSTSINVVANDSDPDGNSISVISNTAATSGALVNNGDGTISYTPNANFSGSDSFTYTLADTLGAQSVATVSITVLGYCASYTQQAAVPFTGAPLAYAPLPDGTVARPYRVCQKNQMDTIAGDNTLWDTEYYELWDNVDVDNAGVNNGIIGTAGNPFNGNFDGRNLSISNFRYIDNTASLVGLFGRIGTGTVKNFTLSTGIYYVDGDQNVGILAGQSDAGATISNVNVGGTITLTGGAPRYVGAVVGNCSANVSSVTSSASITGATADYVGGIIGALQVGGNLTTATSTASIKAGPTTGGIVGRNYSFIDQTNMQGNMVIYSASSGGLIGVNNGTITSSYSEGTYTSYNLPVGGVVGNNYGTVRTVTVTASIDSYGGTLGGVAGRNESGAIVDSATFSGSINQTDATANGNYVGGIVGRNFSLIRGSSTTGTITSAGTTVGGISGSDGGVIELASFSGVITSSLTSVGGIAGSMGGAGTSISDATMTGTLLVANTSIGGIVGALTTPAIISRSLFNGIISQSAAANNVGGIVGSGSGDITYCASRGVIDALGNQVGGVAGTFAGNINNTYALSASITGGSSVGGIAGNLTGQIWSTHSVNTNLKGSSTVGGIVGLNSGTITGSYVLGDINLPSSSGVGGVVGTHYGKLISDSFHVGSLTGLNNTGGVNGAIAFPPNKIVNRSFSISNVKGTGSGIAGISGQSRDPDISRSFSLGDAAGTHNVGGITGGQDGNNFIYKVFSFGTVTSSVSGTAGGIIGRSLSTASITEAYAYGNVFVKGLYAGGIAGQLAGISGLWRNTFHGNIFSTSSTVGGIVGTCAGVLGISDSFFEGNLNTTGSTMGGILGGGTCPIDRSYSFGNLTSATNNQGGIIGSNTGGTINQSYSAGSITTGGVNIGGFVGVDTGGVYTNNFWDITLGGALTHAGDDGNIPGIVAPVTASMSQELNFTNMGWDFVNDWTMPQGVDGNGPPRSRQIYYCNAAYVAGAFNGAGTLDDPIVICNVAQYNQLVGDTTSWNKYIILGDDIDFAGATITSIGTLATPFSGTFDGRGHTLSNFIINDPGTDNIGVFGVIDGDGNGNFETDGFVWALNLRPQAITGQNNVGALVGQLKTGLITMVKVYEGSVNGMDNVGGLVGLSAKQFLQLDSTTASITDHGSLVYRNFANTIISATGDRAGGLVGYNLGRIELSHATGNISGGTTVGGLAGENAGEVIKSKAEPGAFAGGGFTGGAVGVNSGTVTHTFSGNAIPGLIGSNSGAISESYYDSTLSTSVSDGGTALTNAEAQVYTNFVGWDFDLHWILNASYPDFRWER